MAVRVFFCCFFLLTSFLLFYFGLYFFYCNLQLDFAATWLTSDRKILS